jgi:hypothetical protein
MTLGEHGRFIDFGGSWRKEFRYPVYAFNWFWGITGVTHVRWLEYWR